MVETILIISLILAISASVFFYSQLKNERVKTDDSKTSLERLNESVETYKTRSIQLEAEKNSLEKILEIERDSVKNKQAELREQLELIGKDIVNKGSKSLNTENEARLTQILSPLKEKLEKFERKIAENNEKDIKQFTNMETLIKTLSEQHSKVQDTAQNLVNALRGEQKTQGDWGELALERILEFSGLENGREYHTQTSYRNEHGELLRPDVVIQLPDEKHIIIDSKGCK